MKYEDILGQENIAAHFKAALKAGKISHAYLICGEKGCGKKLLARTVAQSIQCTGEGDKPCGKCQACRQVESGNHPDVRFVIKDDTKKAISVDNIREQLVSDMTVKPYVGPKKIYIIDEAEKLNEQAQNAMLKTIEEPPEYGVVLILASSETEMLQTIRSRCVILNMRPVAKDVIKRYLMENKGISEYMAETAAGFSDGNIGKAVDYASSDRFSEELREVMTFAGNITRYNAGDIYSVMAAWAKDKAFIEERLDLLYLYYRDMLVARSAGRGVQLNFKEYDREITRRAEDLSLKEINDCLEAIDKARTRLKYNVNTEATLVMLGMNLK